MLIIFIWAQNFQIITNSTPHEHRMKISLKEFPLTKKPDEVGTLKPKIEPKIAPPLQSQSKLVTQPLQKITPQPQEQQFHQKTINQPVSQQQPEQIKQQQTIIKSTPATQSNQPNKTASNTEKTIQTVPKEVSTPNSKISAPKEHAKLYKFLSKSDNSEANQQSTSSSNQRSSQVDQDVKELYGSKFAQLSPGEQKYILDNMEIMRRITQETLNRVGSVNIPNNLRVNSMNIIEFNLHPNGDMTDFRFLYNSNYYILDDTTRETIQYAYSKYPRPQQTTLIRYRVYYNLRGN